MFLPDGRMRASRREQHRSAALPTRPRARFRDSMILAGCNGGDRSHQNNGCQGEHSRGCPIEFHGTSSDRGGRYAWLRPQTCELLHTLSSTLITPTCEQWRSARDNGAALRFSFCAITISLLIPSVGSRGRRQFLWFADRQTKAAAIRNRRGPRMVKMKPGKKI